MLSLSFGTRIPSTSRSATIAATVPPLRSILVRALHPTPTYLAAGPWTQPRSGSSSTSGRGSPPQSRGGFGRDRDVDFRSSENTPRYSAQTSGRGRSSFTPSSTRGTDRAPASGSRSTYVQRPSAKRLAPLDYLSSQRVSPARNRTPSGQTSTEEHDRPREPYRFPKSQPFQAPTYTTPRSSTSTLDEASPRSFESFDLHPGLVDALRARFGNEAKTTPIQSLAYGHVSAIDGSRTTSENDAVITGERIILGAETGSGKTLAYLVPLFHHLKASEEAHPRSTIHETPSSTPETHLHPRALVLSPTHELTRQSTSFAKSLTHSIKLSVMGMSSTASGGIGHRRGEVDVLLGTVGSARRMLGIRKDNNDELELNQEEVWEKEEGRGVVMGDKVEWVVVDEADVLLGSDFSPETTSILTHLLSLNPQLNIVLCTATLPPSLLSHPLITRSKHSFTHLLSPGLHKLPPKLETRFVPPSRSGNRLADVVHEIRRVFADDALARKQLNTAPASASAPLEKDQGEGQGEKKTKVVIFCNSDKKVQAMADTLEVKGLPCLAWTGEGEHRLRGRNGALDEFLAPSGTGTNVNKKISKRKFELKEDVESIVFDSSSNSDILPLMADNDIIDTSSQVNESPSTPKPHKAPTRRILVTTSLLSRGLDFSSSVSTVILLDPPRDVLDFVHRAGRAGRAGRPGRVLVFGLGDGSGVGSRKDRPVPAAGTGAGVGGLGKYVGDVIGRKGGNGAKRTGVARARY